MPKKPDFENSVSSTVSSLTEDLDLSVTLSNRTPEPLSRSQSPANGSSSRGKMDFLSPTTASSLPGQTYSQISPQELQFRSPVSPFALFPRRSIDFYRSELKDMFSHRDEVRQKYEDVFTENEMLLFCTPFNRVGRGFLRLLQSPTLTEELIQSEFNLCQVELSLFQRTLIDESEKKKSLISSPRL